MSTPENLGRIREDERFFPVLWMLVLLVPALLGCSDVRQDLETNVSKTIATQRHAAHANSDAAAGDWPQFRGGDFLSSTDAVLPVQWSTEQGLQWRCELPGRGASSPVVSGDRIYLTAYDGYGLSLEDPGDCLDLRHHLLCFQRGTGEPLWHREITGTHLNQKMNPELVRHGFASSTPVTDGQAVFAFFGVTGLFAFDTDGNPLWQRNLGLNTHYFGSSASPLLHGDLLIVNASLESNSVYALNKRTGAAVWKIPNIQECWSMPIIGENAEGQQELVISSKNVVAGFDPETGTPLWHCQGIQDYVVSVPIIVDGICYLTGGKTKQTMAIRLGGKGDVSQTHKLWEVGKIGSNVSSPVYRDGRLYIFHDSGVIQVLDARDGAVISRSRTSTRERPFASPLLAGQHIYMPFQDSGISVFRADAEGEEVNVMPLDDELPLMASIVPDGNNLLYRNDRFLYCVGATAESASGRTWPQHGDSQIVTTIESYNIDPDKGWSRRYLGFLTADFEQAIKWLLMPYQSVITEQQTERSREIIFSEKPKYDALRDRFESLQWEELTTPAEAADRFHEPWAALEKDTQKLNADTRILVKNLFPEEQLQRHYRDAEAGVAHIKPGDSGKKK